MAQTDIGKISCDRCGREIPDAMKFDDGTCGFYDVSPGSYWAKFAKPHVSVVYPNDGGPAIVTPDPEHGEREVCDSCMHADPDYRRDYPLYRGPCTAQ